MRSEQKVCQNLLVDTLSNYSFQLNTKAQGSTLLLPGSLTSMKQDTSYQDRYQFTTCLYSVTLFSSERALCRYISQHPKRLKVNKPTVILIQLVRGNQGKKIDFFFLKPPCSIRSRNGEGNSRCRLGTDQHCLRRTYNPTSYALQPLLCLRSLC